MVGEPFAPSVALDLTGRFKPVAPAIMNARLLLSLALVAVTGFAQAPYPGYDSEHGPVTTHSYIAPYTGNVHVATNDLTVAGAVGQYGLGWQRFGNSRTTGATLLFGSGHNWSHNWQWEMVNAGLDDQGRAVLTVHEPAGAVHRFVETAPRQWRPEAAISQEIVSEGGTFRLLLSGGGEVHFIRQGAGPAAAYQLEAVLDDAGNRWTFDWWDGQLIQVNEPAGRWLKIRYTTLKALGAGATTVISQVAASDGQVVAYEYDFPAGVAYPVLTGVTYPDATHAAYAYAVPRLGDRLLLEQAEDPRGSREMRGRKARYRTEPDAAEGQVAQVETADGRGVFDALSADSRESRSYALKLPNGGAIGNVYHPGGHVAEETDANGFAQTHEYAAGGRGFRISTTDELGHVTRFENDANGLVIKTTFPDGSFKTWQRDARGRVLAETDELGQTRRYTRDERGRVTKVQWPDGSTIETTYNDFGQVLTMKDRGGAVTTMTYDARGLRTKVTNALGATTTFAYDARDRLIATTDARGNTTRFEGDNAGRVGKVIFADGASVRTEYNEFGQVTKNTNALDATSTMVYDQFGRLITSRDPLGQATERIYPALGDSASFNKQVGIVSPSGHAIYNGYDSNGRLVNQTIATGTPESATTRYAYDPAGRMISFTDPRGETVQFFYDERGRRIRTMSALNHATTTTYDAAGRKISETDAKGNTTRWTYDAMGRELTKTDAKGQVTRREYNSAGLLVALTDAKLNTYRFEYDLLGRQTALVYPDGSRETTAYDATGLKTSFTNRAGTVQTFAYDNRNREIRSEWSDGSQKIVKAYDAAGRMTLEDNGVSKLTFTYDAAGRLTSEKQDLSPIVTGGQIDPEPRAVRYTYTPDGERDSLIYPDGSLVRFTFNARSELKEIFGGNGTLPIASYEYDAAGNATRMPRQNDTETERKFDAENKATEIVEHASNYSPLSKLDYLYDEAGNRTATLTALNPDGRGAKEETLDTYRYDETYQVTRADYVAPVQGNKVNAPALTEKFTYDAVGNRLEVGRVAPNAPAVITRYAVNNLNQYTQVGEFAPTHDRNGNLSGMGQWLYHYDAMNRLVFASNGTIMARFFYDAKNRCVARNYQSTGSPLTAPSSTATLNYYDNWNLIEERDGFKAQQARYVHGRKIDELIVMVNQYGTFYPHHDALGNATFLTDSTGKLVERYIYSVDGKFTIENANDERVAFSSVGNRWLFTGREWLPELALYDYRNRIYSSATGRFLQSDPLRFNAGDINIYRYADNNYLIYADPFGLQTFSVGSGVTVSPGAGFSSSGGVFLNTNNGAWYDCVGMYSSNTGFGGTVGIDASAGAYFGFTNGPISNFQGNAMGINLGVGPFDVSRISNPTTGEVIGDTWGASASTSPISLTVTFTETRTVTLGDIFRGIRDAWNAIWNSE